MSEQRRSGGRLFPLAAGLIIGAVEVVLATESQKAAGVSLVAAAAAAGPMVMAQTLAAGGGPGERTLHESRPWLR